PPRPRAPPPMKARPPPKPPPPKPRASAVTEDRLATATVAAAARDRMSLRDMVILRVWGLEVRVGAEVNSNARGTKDPEEGSKDFLRAAALPKYRQSAGIQLMKRPVKGRGAGKDRLHTLLPPCACPEPADKRQFAPANSGPWRPARRGKFSSFWLEPAGRCAA